MGLGFGTDVRVFQGRDAKWVEDSPYSGIGMFREYFLPWMANVNTNPSIVGQHEFVLDEDWNQGNGSPIRNFINLYINDDGQGQNGGRWAIQLRWREDGYTGWELEDYHGTHFVNKGTTNGQYGYVFNQFAAGYGNTNDPPTSNDDPLTYQWAYDDTDGQEFFGFGWTVSRSTYYKGGMLFFRTTDGHWASVNSGLSNDQSTISQRTRIGYDPVSNRHRSGLSCNGMTSVDYVQPLNFEVQQLETNFGESRVKWQAASPYLYTAGDAMGSQAAATFWDLNVDGTFRGPFLRHVHPEIVVFDDPFNVNPRP